MRAWVCGLLLWAAVAGAERPGYVTVLLYHRFGEAKYPSTNISVEKFREQLQYLRDENYRVLNMEEFRTLLEEKAALLREQALRTCSVREWVRCGRASHPRPGTQSPRRAASRRPLRKSKRCSTRGRRPRS